MSTTPKRYVKRPVEISAFELTQYGDFVRAAAWINANGGQAVFSPKLNPKSDVEDTLIITTLEGDMEATAGAFIIQGVQGEFYPCKGDIFRETYDLVGTEPEVVGEYHSPTLLGTGYAVGGNVLRAEAAVPT